MRPVRPGDGHPGDGHRCSLARTGFALLARKSSTGVRRLSVPEVGR
ncbi:MAG: hypothetical protein OXG40_01120 [Acidimicrobiaceae bacterium]|nr:hypothetical protein [Acidimicrobiaceae bacterium]MDE0517625.1 hypothetical protein [Acidimicrobiaceae bacterium]